MDFNISFFIATALLIISYLLGTYYYLKANEDDLNRPSFFNSQTRKYFLLFLIALSFLAGTYLFIKIDLIEYVFMILVICFTIHGFIKEDWRKNLIITRMFKYYKIFKNPDTNYDQKEQLIVPILFMLTEMRVDKNYQVKAQKYLEKRTKEGKFTKIKDIPQEAWTIFQCINQKEIRESENRLEQSKIDYFYEEVVEGKSHRNLKTVLSDIFWGAEIFLERIFVNFSFVNQARPDFTEEEIQLTTATISDPKTKKKEGEKTIAVFPDVDVRLAQKFGWVKDVSEYLDLATLEFSRRYPEHKFSKEAKKRYKYTNEQIFDYAQNWEKLDTKKINNKKGKL